ncbi:MAG: MATE family efflux transporter [Oscillospiraceae bacterium]|nr:MATE family efflux transporter [Oscillospiraceae bacterium]MBQ1619366.1 MATE family efflux transporter [Oscillospiraceae bacterium]
MEQHLDRKNLTEGVVWKKLLIFFLPIAAGTCIQQLYNAVDGLILGRFVGTTALAAVGGSSAQIINLLIGFFVAITSGASVVIAQVYGANRARDVQIAAGNAIAVFALLGLLLMGFGLVLSPAMLRLLKTPADTLEDAILYLRIYFIGVPFILVLNMESNMLRSVGDSVSPFLYMVAGCVTNILLDSLFVLVLGWGVAGVAVATVAAQVLNMGMLTWRLMTTKESYRLSLRELRLKGVYLKNMLWLGVPAGLQSSMYAVSNMIIQVGVNSLGTVVVASWVMTGKTDGIFWAVSNALGAAITSFVGQNRGAGRDDRVKLCVKQGMILATVITLTLSGIIMLTGRPLLYILTKDQAVRDTTWLMMIYFVPYYFTWVVIEVLSGVLRGCGDAVRPVIIIGLGICLLRIVWIVTLFAQIHTLFVLCLCYPVSWILTSAAMLVYYRKGSWKNRGSVIVDH